MAGPIIIAIGGCLKTGLKALGQNSQKVAPKNTRNCNWSIDLDNCLQPDFPNDPRWDYVICYDKKTYFMEVHHASTSDVGAVINKLQWLRNWLDGDGITVKNMRADNKFHWIFTNKNGISRQSKYARRIALAGLSFPQRQLKLPH